MFTTSVKGVGHKMIFLKVCKIPSVFSDCTCSVGCKILDCLFDENIKKIWRKYRCSFKKCCLNFRTLKNIHLVTLYPPHKKTKNAAKLHTVIGQLCIIFQYCKCIYGWKAGDLLNS